MLEVARVNFIQDSLTMQLCAFPFFPISLWLWLAGCFCLGPLIFVDLRLQYCCIYSICFIDMYLQSYSILAEVGDGCCPKIVFACGF